MEPKLLKKRGRPEDKIKEAIKVFLEARGWKVYATHGGMFQSGFPDLWITHPKYGGKWVEVKLPGMQGSSWTKAQKKTFPEWVDNGTPIWVLTGANEYEYRKLFQSNGNLLEYLLIK